MLGIVWAVLLPLIMLGVYSFVFGHIFEAKWGKEQADGTTFTLLLFAGLTAFNLFADVASKAPNLVAGHPNLVKKVVFPLEILPAAAMASSLFQATICVIILVVAQLFLGQALHATILALPIIALPLCLATLGIGWFLSAIGVYVRDIGQIVPAFLSAMLFLTPIFYPPAAMPDWMQLAVRFNPLAYPIDDIRNAIIFGTLPGLQQWCITLMAGAAVAILGFGFFSKTRKGFADVL